MRMLACLLPAYLLTYTSTRYAYALHPSPRTTFTPQIRHFFFVALGWPESAICHSRRVSAEAATLITIPKVI
ncbi:hypothetical protein F4859DRAFT_336042 [Xylaria cf. heliscus]|nr:hypothetical protein F4859DRAFT_336042 [Xylaria cf. heliscus]